MGAEKAAVACTFGILGGNFQHAGGRGDGRPGLRAEPWEGRAALWWEEKGGADAPPSAKRYILPLASSVLTQVAHILPSFSVAVNQTIAPSLGAPPSTLVLSFQ